MNEDLNVSAHHHQLPREPQQTVTVSSCFTLETALGQKSDGHSHYPAITNEGSDGHPDIQTRAKARDYTLRQRFG